MFNSVVHVLGLLSFSFSLTLPLVNVLWLCFIFVLESCRFSGNRGQFTTNGVVSVIFGCSSLDLLDALDCTEVNAEYIEENILPHVRACGRLGTYLLSRHEEGQYRVYRQLTPRSPMHTPWLPAAWFTTVRSNDHNPSLVNYFPANKADYVQSRGAEPPYGMYNLEWTLN